MKKVQFLFGRAVVFAAGMTLVGLAGATFHFFFTARPSEVREVAAQVSKGARKLVTRQMDSHNG